MKAILSILFITGLFSSKSFAQQSGFTPRAYNPVFQCPETHPEYTKLLKNLREFQAQLKAKSDCEDLSVDVEKFTNLLGAEREDFLKLITRNEDGVLNAESTEKIQNYSAAVTEQVATLIRLISGAEGDGIIGGAISWLSGGTKRCVLEEEDRFAGVQRITSAAYEASKLISKVAGPYGVPISIAANTMFGVIQGLQTFIDKSEPIDFDQPEKREFFAESLCLFSSFEADIRKLNNPQSHLQSLEKVRRNALKAVNEIRYLCPECNVLMDSESSDKAKLKEDAANINQIYSTNLNLGSKSLTAKENLAWVDEEIAKFKDIIDFPTQGIGPRELQSIKIILSDFLLKTASPSFMKWYLNKSYDAHKLVVKRLHSAYSEVTRELNDKGIPDTIQYPENPHGQNAVLHHTTDLLILYSLNQDLELTDYSPQLYSLLRETFEYWKLTEQNLKIVDEYCNFFTSNLLYPRSIENICESSKKNYRDSVVAYQAFLLADLFEASKEMSIIGPFDFSLNYHIGQFPAEKASYFVDTQRLLIESTGGNSMNLTSSDKENTPTEFYPNWLDASEAHIDNLIQGFRVLKQSPLDAQEGPF